MTSQKIKKALTVLKSNDLYLCDHVDGNMCLKNSFDDIVYLFELLPNKTSLESLQISLNKLNDIVNKSLK